MKQQNKIMKTINNGNATWSPEMIGVSIDKLINDRETINAKVRIDHFLLSDLCQTNCNPCATAKRDSWVTRPHDHDREVATYERGC